MPLVPTAVARVFTLACPPQPDHAGKSMSLGEFLEGLIRVASLRYSVLEEKPDMLTSLRMLLEEKILPMAAEMSADPFLAVWHHKTFLQMLAHKSNLLIKSFKSLANMDPDMKFYTMSLKEWTMFIQKLNIAAQGFTHRDTKNAFWRAQGAFAPEFGTMVALKEREEFLEKLHATDELEVRARDFFQISALFDLPLSQRVLTSAARCGTTGCGQRQHTGDELPGVCRGRGASGAAAVLEHAARGPTRPS